MSLTIVPHVFHFWANRSRCIACKQQVGPMLLPTGTDDPRACPLTHSQVSATFNGDNLMHLADTHGFDNDTIVAWVLESIYGKKLSWT